MTIPTRLSCLKWCVTFYVPFVDVGQYFSAVFSNVSALMSHVSAFYFQLYKKLS